MTELQILDYDPRKFAPGQTVFCNSLSRDPFRVIGFEWMNGEWHYILENERGETARTTESLLKRMRPIAREVKTNGKVRTVSGYFFVIQGGRAA